MDSRYAQNAGATFSLKYHIVRCPKSRRPVLEGAVAGRLKALLAEKATELGLTIHALDVLPDHVHRFVEGDPTRCVAEIVNRLKGYTSHVLRGEFPSLRSRLPTLWSRSYYAGGVGHVSAATVERYIAEPKGE
jgi:putative transposase